MLNLLLNLSDEASQVLLGSGEKSSRLLRGASAYVKRCWLSEDLKTCLVFYSRPAKEGMNEVGICFGPGPSCNDSGKFSTELLRVFYEDEECFDSTQSYYEDLVQENNFHEICIFKIVLP